MYVLFWFTNFYGTKYLICLKIICNNAYCASIVVFIIQFYLLMFPLIYERRTFDVLIVDCMALQIWYFLLLSTYKFWKKRSNYQCNCLTWKLIFLSFHQNYGAHLEKDGAGFRGPIKLVGCKNGDLDLTKSFWTYQVVHPSPAKSCCIFCLCSKN